MPNYDRSRFDPPAPLAQVTLRNHATGALWTDVPMLLDSGADVTLVPRAVIERLNVTAIPLENYRLMGFDDNLSLAEMVSIDVLFLGRTYHGEFLLIDQEYGVIGRNILNTVVLIFDGPHLVWDRLRRG